MAATGPPSLRSTFENGLGVIFQCRPRGGYSHSFNSDGSFQLHAYGQMINHGGGSSANGDAYAYHTMSHNSILVDGLGQAQTSRGQVLPYYGRIAAFSRGDDYVYFAGDVTGCYPRTPGDFSRWSLPLDKIYQERALPYLERFIRHVLFLHGRYFIIYDDLSCSQPAIYTWLYHILPEEPFTFDKNTFTVDYKVGEVDVRLRHLAHPEGLELDDRVGMQAFVNPLTGEDYRQTRVGDILCGHNLWVSNTAPARKWSFLTVIYPARSGQTIPDGVHYDLWLGPAPKRPFSRNRFHYNWHWNWEYGNGDMGNQGVHEMDVARWGLGVKLPTRVCAMGGHVMFDDDQNTPNVLMAMFEFPNERGAGDKKKILQFEVRHWISNREDGMWMKPDPKSSTGYMSSASNTIGNLFYGSKGYMAKTVNEWRTYMGKDCEPGETGSGLADHYANYIEAIRGADPRTFNKSIEEGFYSCALIHLANISHRLDRSLDFDPMEQRFINDDQANGMLTRDYRKPFVVPEQV